jgi:hypothetical protein
LGCNTLVVSTFIEKAAHVVPTSSISLANEIRMTTGDRPIRSPFFSSRNYYYGVFADEIFCARKLTLITVQISRQIRGPNPVWTRQIMDTTDRPAEVRIPAEDEQRASGCNYHIRSGLVSRKRNDVRDGMPSTDESLTALFHPTILYFSRVKYGDVSNKV